MSLSLTFISLVSTLPDSRSRTHLSYNATGGGGRVRESLIIVLYKTITRFKNGLRCWFAEGTSTCQNRRISSPKSIKTSNSTCQNEWINSPKQTIQLTKLIKLDTSTHQNKQFNLLN